MINKMTNGMTYKQLHRIAFILLLSGFLVSLAYVVLDIHIVTESFEDGSGFVKIVYCIQAAICAVP